MSSFVTRVDVPRRNAALALLFFFLLGLCESITARPDELPHSRGDMRIVALEAEQGSILQLEPRGKTDVTTTVVKILVLGDEPLRSRAMAALQETQRIVLTEITPLRLILLSTQVFATTL